jgi:hypothetical protein
MYGHRSFREAPITKQRYRWERHEWEHEMNQITAAVRKSLSVVVDSHSGSTFGQ